jgi:hypothetical protein
MHWPVPTFWIWIGLVSVAAFHPEPDSGDWRAAEAALKPQTRSP